MKYGIWHMKNGTLLDDLVFDAAVLEPAVLSIVTGDRVAVPITLRYQGVRVNSFVDEEAAHRIGSLLGELLIGGGVTDVIGITAHLEYGPGRRRFDRRSGLFQHRHAI